MNIVHFESELQGFIQFIVLTDNSCLKKCSQSIRPMNLMLACANMGKYAIL
jgi:hypothetical protein